MNINKLKSYLIFNTCAIIILLSLGTWQLERLQWKNRYISQIETKMSMPAIEINENNSIYLDTYKNRKVTIKGSYLYDKKITLHSKVYNKLVGKHLLVPLKTDYGYLLVNRGFITDAGLKNLNEDTEVLNISTTTIEAVKNHTINPTLQGGNTYASVTAIPANTVAMGANLASSNSCLLYTSDAADE